MGHLPIQRRHGRQIILYIMHAGNSDLLGRNHRLSVQTQHAIQQRRALRASVLPGEPAHLAGGSVRQRPGFRVVPIEHHNTAFILMTEQVALGFHILLHACVPIQMIGRQVGDHRHCRRLLHAHQLERRQLQHHAVGGLHLVCLIQQRRTDVAAHPYSLARCPQHLSDHRGGGRLSIRSGDCDNGARAHLKEHFHLAGDLSAGFLRLYQCGHIGTHTGGAEHHVGLYAFQILLAQHQFDAHCFQITGQIAQLLPRFFISCGNNGAAAGQQVQQRPVAYTDAHYRHSLTLQGCQICL